jgi:hypothetical protein
VDFRRVTLTCVLVLSQKVLNKRERPQYARAILRGGSRRFLLAGWFRARVEWGHDNSNARRPTQRQQVDCGFQFLLGNRPYASGNGSCRCDCHLNLGVHWQFEDWWLSRQCPPRHKKNQPTLKAPGNQAVRMACVVLVGRLRTRHLLHEPCDAPL